MNKLTRWIALPLLSLTLPLTGCTTKQQPDNSAAKPATAAMAAKLAAADKVDGTEDKVVHRCAGCMLNMDGKKEMALEVGEYEMHFCKDACLARFEGSTEKEVMALKVPE